MARALRKDTPLIDKEKPDVSIGNVIDAIRHLGDRAAILRRLETEDKAAEEAFDARAKQEWDALDFLRELYQQSPPSKQNMDDLDATIEKRIKIADAKRSAHNAVLEMVRGLIPTVVKATGKSEDWVTRALEFTTRPAQREAQHAIDFLFELEALAAEVDPDNKPSGDILGPNDRAEDWLKRMMAG